MRSPRRSIALVALALAFGLVQLDATIVNVAIDSVRRDLGGSTGLGQWLVDSYAVPFAALLLAGGALGDHGGQRRTCLGGTLVFAVACAAAALAPGWVTLVAARVAQGVGAAMLLPTSLALIAELYPEPEERSRALGVWGGLATTGFALGPVLGGWVITAASWRTVFWVMVPPALVVASVIALTAPPGERRGGRLDLIGALLAVLTLGATAGAVIEAGEGRWPAVLALAAAAVGSMVLLVRHQRRTAEPLVPHGLLGDAVLRGALTLGWCFNFALYGALLVVSLTLQGAYGFGPLTGGLSVLPMALVVLVGATTSGRLTAHFGHRMPLLLGFGSASVGLAVLGAAGTLGSAPGIVVGLTITGLVSLAMPAMTALALSRAPEGLSGLVSGTLNAARQVGGAVGVAVLGALLVLGERAGVGTAGLAGLVALAVGILTTLRATRIERSEREGARG